MRKVLFLLFVSVVGLTLTGCPPAIPDPALFIERGQAYDVRILRDTWGVPHIFGKTDPDCAYGLAYAHCEDDFETLFEGILLVRGQLASLDGVKAAPFDYMVHLLRVWDTVEAKYHTEVSPEMRALCEAAAAGLNHYAALHPDEVPLGGILPVTGEDLIAGAVLKTPFFYGVDNTFRRLLGFDRKRKHPGDEVAAVTPGFVFHRGQELGSNTFAVAPGRSADGHTRLNVNSHQPFEGPLAWYEAHVHSEEGWDCVGGVFPGTPLILHGHNRHLGWAHTVNRPDLVDVYELVINPENPMQYRLDGEWHDLEVRMAPITVRLAGPWIKWTFKRECLWSPHHGPVLRNDKGTYAIRYAGMDEVRQFDQWFRMNKATNLEEFKDACRINGIPSFNIGYADQEGNILYVYNMAAPKRNPKFDWSGYLPGDTSDAIWHEYLPFDAVPQVLNPPSGFIQNCNNTPYYTTTGEANPKPEDFPAWMGIETQMTNRAYRALELLGGDDSITAEEFLEYKFDLRYSEDSPVKGVIDEILALPDSGDPIVEEAKELIATWDHSTDLENKNAAIAILVLEPIVRALMFDRPAPDVAATLKRRAHFLKKTHGRLDVPWKEVNRLRRGDLDLPLSGGPDTLRAVYGDLEMDGRLVAEAGDCYVLIADWDKNGQVRSASIHQYGSATMDESSPHYADQAPLFAALQLKPVWFDEKDIRANLEREYRPGEEAATAAP